MSDRHPTISVKIILPLSTQADSEILNTKTSVHLLKYSTKQLSTVYYLAALHHVHYV